MRRIEEPVFPSTFHSVYCGAVTAIKKAVLMPTPSVAYPYLDKEEIEMVEIERRRRR